ncbi:MAG: AAA family ATPase [Ferruginibacter sp.]
MEEQFFQERTNLSVLNDSMEKIRAEIGKVIVGQQEMLDLLMIGLLCDGHILIEGVPGVAKTLTAKLLSKIVDVEFSRLQFTPDLMPSDVTGTSVFNPKEGSFQFKAGPVFSNIVLIDEINRAPAKTQAALFEVMEERQVTVDGYTHPMRFPFIILATQNPIEQEGTYRLPEAQLDRFIFKIEVRYPNLEEEIAILNNQHGRTQKQLLEDINSVLKVEDIQHFRDLVQAIVIEPKLVEYIARIVQETRTNSALYLGASPRASLAILRASKASAAIHGRDFVTPEDIVQMVPPVLRHRIMLTPEKEMEGLTTDDLIQQLLKAIEIPR